MKKHSIYGIHFRNDYKEAPLGFVIIVQMAKPLNSDLALSARISIMIIIILLFIFAYVVGSVNFSILLFKVLGKGDPRNKFSENAGVTNVYRQTGIGWAIVVFALDISRAAGVALMSVLSISAHMVPVIGFGLILGNRFPCFHGFKGGKGVANYFGFTAALTPLSAVISGIVWLCVYALLRQPFLASFGMVIILAAGTLMDYHSDGVAVLGVLTTAAFIIINHRRNLIEFLRSKNKA